MWVFHRQKTQPALVPELRNLQCEPVDSSRSLFQDSHPLDDDATIVCDSVQSVVRDREIPEVAFGSGADPETDLAARHAALQIVHDQRGLRRGVDEEPGARVPLTSTFRCVHTPVSRST